MTRQGTARLLRAGLLAIALLGAGALASAQDEPDPMEERAETFEAARQGAQTENVPGGTLMIAAYGAVFLLVLGYVVSLSMRQARTQRELERLRQDLEAYARENPSRERPPEEL